MRTVTFGVANSLDNYIARPDGGVDWLLWTPEVSAITKDLFQTIDTVVMGRKTYEAGARAGMPVFPGVKNYVVSRAMREAPHPEVEIVSMDAAAFIRQLREQEGKGICIMGGGILAQALFQEDLIDEVGVNIHPVLLGSGIPLFPGATPQIDLDLRECKVLSSGCVYILYRVVRAVKS